MADKNGGKRVNIYFSDKKYIDTVAKEYLDNHFNPQQLVKNLIYMVATGKIDAGEVFNVNTPKVTIRNENILKETKSINNEPKETEVIKSETKETKSVPIVNRNDDILVEVKKEDKNKNNNDKMKSLFSSMSSF